MTPREQLLRQVLERPDDNTLRLVYADCIQESGKPWDEAHAELIRLQVNRIDAPVAAVSESLRNEERLLKRYGAKWLPPLARADAATTGRWVHGDQIDVGMFLTNVRYTFERGFVSTVLVEWGGSTLDGPNVGEFVQQCLAHRPMHTFGFLVTAHAPNLTLCVGPHESAPAWVAKLTDADDPGAFWEEFVASDRKIFVSEVKDFLKTALAGIEFERHTDYEPDYEPPDDGSLEHADFL